MDTLSAPAPTLPVPALAAALLAWLALVFALATSGALLGARPLIPALILGPTALLLALYARGGRVRATAERLPTRALVGLHVLRAPIGWMFLGMLADGRLPELFATRAGYGDIVAGVGALLVLPFVTRRTERTEGAGRALVLVWNVVALADILLVVGTAQYLVFVVEDPLMLALAEPPYLAIPFLLVPSVLLSHALVFHRLVGSR